MTDIGKWLVCSGQGTTVQHQDGGVDGATGVEVEALHLQGQGEDHLHPCQDSGKVEENCADLFTVENEIIPLFDLIKLSQMNLKHSP